MSGVEITIRDIYDALMRLTGQVEAGRASDEVLRATSKDHEDRLRRTELELAALRELIRVTGDHEGRVRDLEKWARALPAALIVSLASLAVAAVAVFAH